MLMVALFLNSFPAAPMQLNRRNARDRQYTAGALYTVKLSPRIRMPAPAPIAGASNENGAV